MQCQFCIYTFNQSLIRYRLLSFKTNRLWISARPVLKHSLLGSCQDQHTILWCWYGTCGKTLSSCVLVSEVVWWTNLLCQCRTNPADTNSQLLCVGVSSCWWQTNHANTNTQFIDVCVSSLWEKCHVLVSALGLGDNSSVLVSDKSYKPTYNSLVLVSEACEKKVFFGGYFCYICWCQQLFGGQILFVGVWQILLKERLDALVFVKEVV